MQELSSSSQSNPIPKPKSSSLVVRLGEESWEVSSTPFEGNTLPKSTSRNAASILQIEQRTKAPITLHSMRMRIESTRADANQAKRREEDVAASQDGSLPHTQRPWHQIAKAFLIDLLAPPTKKRALSTLRGGILVGLILGCLTMILFHELVKTDISDIVPSAHVQKVAPSSITSSPPVRTISMSLPGFQVAFAESGPLSSSQQLHQVLASMARRGDLGVASNDSTRTVIWAVALSPTAAKENMPELPEGIPSEVTTERQVAKAVAVLSTVGAKDLQATQTWLSSTSAALLSMTAWLSDHGRVSDAGQALDGAVSSYPGNRVVSETGIGPQLQSIQRDLQNMRGEFEKKQTGALMKSVISGFDEFMALHGVEEVSS